MAGELMVDLYGCDTGILDNLPKIQEIAHQIIKEIHAEIVEECFHKFEPIGITYIDCGNYHFTFFHSYLARIQLRRSGYFFLRRRGAGSDRGKAEAFFGCGKICGT